MKLRSLIQAWLHACLAVATPSAFAAGDVTGTWVVTAQVSTLRTMEGTLPPLRADALAVYRARVEATQKNDRSWDPVARCKPPGEPRTMVEEGWPFEILQSAGRIDVLFQWNRLNRAIAIAESQQLDPLAPFYFGQSVGRWEGDTLVVSVIALKENTMLDPSGLPHSDELVLTERFRTIDGGRKLEVKLHVVDPKLYTRPWDAMLTFRRLPSTTRIVEDVCIERLKLQDYATLENSLAP